MPSVVARYGSIPLSMKKTNVPGLSVGRLPLRM
jgi:hypothetical protein